MTTIRSILMLTLLAGAAACASTPQQVQLPPDQLFERGQTQLNERKWTEAIATFEQFVIQYPTHPRVQEARFRLGEGYYGKKEYISAGNEFSRLAGDFPAGPYADDARFKVCESYYRLSPKTQLDQQYTRAAYDHCQSLIAYFPDSEFSVKGRELSAELRDKLAEKEYQAGEFYFKRGAFDSAIIYYDTTLRDFADSAQAPRALARLISIYQSLGYKEEEAAARTRLLTDYPASPEARAIQSPATANP